ncbi:MAG: NADH-quinone oxidoreductase subunit L [Acidobacteria bacterium]|nr:NADH-quinone oxidoreductase subunit L [Acidobacteriota bacterium]MBW4044152.1 NADH-quinone oxidoreductase subunit L [Acidobacteriota bacterium]
MAHLQCLWPSHHAILLCVPSVLYFLGGFAGQLVSIQKLSIRKAWRLTRIASSLSLLLSFACCSDALLHTPALVRRPRISSLLTIGSFHLSFRFDVVEALMLLLVTFLGWVIVSYSRAYMSGDPKEPRYIGNLMRTLAAVSLLVVTNNLVLFLVAWVLTSLSLHGLLTLYPHRQAAVIAAHKKFLASRLGDFTLLCGVMLLGSQTGSFEMDEVMHRISGSHPIPASIHVAALLLAISAMIKCAQLPLHGWLIQVMEAPTPVSALLHAGVVNLGGFMLIRLAPVINTTQMAQGLLVVIGCLTAIISSLVMTTRISIKVHLAWSTCAQMGFMLMECGLGLYGLAFLHLLAHSLYKAHAFLGSGGTVNQAKLKRMMPPRPETGVNALIGSAISGLFVAILGALLWQPHLRVDAAMIFCITVVGLATTGILAAISSTCSIAASLLLPISALGISVLYFGYDRLFQRLAPLATIGPAHQHAILIFPVACFALLYTLHAIIRANPLGQIATTLYPWFYAGLYLDELFTRATFRIWPAKQSSEITRRRDAAQPFEARGVRL